MPTERLSMRRIRQVLQLHFGARSSARVIGGTVGVGRSTVQDYLARATAAGLVWPLAPELTDEALEQLLFPAPRNRPGARRYVEPDWAALVREIMQANPFDGAIYVFRAKRADRLKLLFWDGTGVCLLAKWLEESVFSGRRSRTA